MACSASGNYQYSYTVPGITKIGDLKKKLDSFDGVSCDNMKLTLNGKILDDDSKMMIQVGFS
jgi:hypothetical protein